MVADAEPAEPGIPQPTCTASANDATHSHLPARAGGGGAADHSHVIGSAQGKPSLMAPVAQTYMPSRGPGHLDSGAVPACMRDSASVHQGYGLQQQPSGPSVPGGCQPAVGAATQQAPSQPTIKSEPRTEQMGAALQEQMAVAVKTEHGHVPSSQGAAHISPDSCGQGLANASQRPAQMPGRWLPPPSGPHWDMGAPTPHPAGDSSTGLGQHMGAATNSMPAPSQPPASSIGQPGPAAPSLPTSSSGGQAQQQHPSNSGAGQRPGPQMPAATASAGSGQGGQAHMQPQPSSMPPPPPHHPGAMPGGYPYMPPPYGDPHAYPPPHMRPPYHPPPPGHMMPPYHHPGYPPPPHPLAGPRPPFYTTQDGRYVPMPGCHPGHPGGPPFPPPHPAYYRPGMHPYYMPPPYGPGPHPGMHPGAFHPMQPHPHAHPGMPQHGMPGAPGSMPPHSGAEQGDSRQGQVSGPRASSGTACPAGQGLNSDGGSNPTSDMPACAAGKAGGENGSSGGSGVESDELGLEAVIHLRGGGQHEQQDSGTMPTAPAANSGGAAGQLPSSERPGTATGLGNGDGSGAGSLPVGGLTPLTLPHNLDDPLPRISWPGYPPSGVGAAASMGSYDWAGFPPNSTSSGGSWMYGGYDPALHPNAPAWLSGELQDDGLSALDMNPRRRLSSMGGGLGSNGGGLPGSAGPLMCPPSIGGRKPSASQLYMPYASLPVGAAPACAGAAGRQSGGGKQLPPQALQQQQQQQQAGLEAIPPLPIAGDGQDWLLGGKGMPQRTDSPGALLQYQLGSTPNLPDSGGGHANVSRRTQRLKQRRTSLDHLHPGATPDHLSAPSSAGGAPGSGGSAGLPPLIPGARRSSNGSAAAAMQGRSAFQPIAGRQRSEPGYLIEGMEPGCWPGGPMGTGALPGFPMMPLSGLEIPPPPPLQLQGSMQHMGGQGPSSRRSTETGSGGRPITLPKRYEDSIMTTEYHNKPAPTAQPAVRRTSKGAPPMPRGPFGYDTDFYVGPHGAMPPMPHHHPGHHMGQAEHHQEEHEEQEEQEQYEDEDSDEDYGGDGRRGGGRGMYGIAAGGDPSRKRKAPTVREELQPAEKKRKARDPATISKVVVNCVIILRMVSSQLVYEKEIRAALGNNPDTSKALRLLVTQGKLVRSGQGGRGNPFCYKCTPLGLATLQRILDAAEPGADNSADPNKEQRAAAVAV